MGSHGYDILYRYRLVWEDNTTEKPPFTIVKSIFEYETKAEALTDGEYRVTQKNYRMPQGEHGKIVVLVDEEKFEHTTGDMN